MTLCEVRFTQTMVHLRHGPPLTYTQSSFLPSTGILGATLFGEAPDLGYNSFTTNPTRNINTSSNHLKGPGTGIYVSPSAKARNVGPNFPQPVGSKTSSKNRCLNSPVGSVRSRSVAAWPLENLKPCTLRRGMKTSSSCGVTVDVWPLRES